jgi:hypothetical protein
VCTVCPAGTISAAGASSCTANKPDGDVPLPPWALILLAGLLLRGIRAARSP